MNKRDSEMVKGMLEEKGYAFSESENDADIIIFNTCSVREHAEQRAVSILGFLSRKKRKHGKRIFGLIGCVAQHRKEALFKSLPNIHFICGPSDIYKIPDLISKAINRRPKITAVRPDRNARPLTNVDPCHRDSKIHAYVNIMYGCDNFCSYCIVPYVRGKEVSRPALDIVAEISELVKRGIKDVTLLGQNVNSYKSGKTDFVSLLKLANTIQGLKRIDFVTSHPKDATTKLFKAMEELDKVVKHLHLPLQSGSNHILKLMNRGYTIEKYKNLIDSYRSIVPGGKISTDIIVGFPTEREEDFNKTKKVIEEMKFDSAYIFKYSPRPPAKSALMKDDIPREEKRKRNMLLLDLQKKISKKKKEAFH